MDIRLSNILSVTAAVIVMDFVVVRLIAPKAFNLLGLSPQSKPGCGCGGNGGSCAKNVTGRSQVIDVTAIRSQGVGVSV